MSTRPTPQSRVKVSARGCLESGEVVDKHKTFVFTVGDGDVIQGIHYCINILLAYMCPSSALYIFLFI